MTTSIFNTIIMAVVFTISPAFATFSLVFLDILFFIAVSFSISIILLLNNKKTGTLPAYKKCSPYFYPFIFKGITPFNKIYSVAKICYFISLQTAFSFPFPYFASSCASVTTFISNGSCTVQGTPIAFINSCCCFVFDFLGFFISCR